MINPLARSKAYTSNFIQVSDIHRKIYTEKSKDSKLDDDQFPFTSSYNKCEIIIIQFSVSDWKTKYKKMDKHRRKI